MMTVSHLVLTGFKNRIGGNEMLFYDKMDYKDVIESMDSSSILFDCHSRSRFLATLSEDGYNCFTRISVGKSIQEMEDVHIPGKYVYISITITRNESDSYGVCIEMRPDSFANKAESDVVLNAAAIMGG